MNVAGITYYQSPLGLLKIAATDRHISEVTFAEKQEDIEMPVVENFLLSQCKEELTEYFSGTRPSFDIPIQQKGTTFQIKVWNELSNIGYGKTISYLALAKRLGDPKCIRAAASTNGKNNICIIVPCHRVIGSNQSLVGYAGGLWRKKWLLDHENRIANGAQTLF